MYLALFSEVIQVIFGFCVAMLMLLFLYYNWLWPFCSRKLEVKGVIPSDLWAAWRWELKAFFASASHPCITFVLLLRKKIIKSMLAYTRGITPKRGANGGTRFRGVAPTQHSSEEPCKCSIWRYCVRFTLPKLEPQTFGAIVMSLTATTTGRSSMKMTN